MATPQYSFQVTWSDEDEAFVAVCPEFEGISGFGSTHLAAIKEAQVALKLAMDVYKENGWALPEPTKATEYSGQFRLRLPKKTHARLARQAAEEGISLNTYVLGLLENKLGAAESFLFAIRQLRDALSGTTLAKGLGVDAATSTGATGQRYTALAANGGSKWLN